MLKRIKRKINISSIAYQDCGKANIGEGFATVASTARILDVYVA